MLDGDVAQTLGAILREELGVASEILVIDGVVLWDFDYIDLGRIRLPSMTVPVTIKSLVFSEDPRLPRGAEAFAASSSSSRQPRAWSLARSWSPPSPRPQVAIADIGMADDDVEVAVIGGGAAGVAAARRLHDAGMRCLVIEGRLRLGGRAWTVTEASGYALDLGCDWLHSADRNPWSADRAGAGLPDRPHATALDAAVDRDRVFQGGAARLFQSQPRLLRTARRRGARARPPGLQLLEPGGRWNNLIVAVNTFVTGAELDRVSAHDIVRYDDTGVNWRVFEGYGTAVAGHGAGLPVTLDCPVYGSTMAGFVCGSKRPRA